MDTREQNRRKRQNVVALVVLAILLLGGAWLLIHHLQSAADVLDCLSAGRHDCGPTTAPGP